MSLYICLSTYSDLNSRFTQSVNCPNNHKVFDRLTIAIRDFRFLFSAQMRSSYPEKNSLVPLQEQLSKCMETTVRKVLCIQKVACPYRSSVHFNIIMIGIQKEKEMLVYPDLRRLSKTEQ